MEALIELNRIIKNISDKFIDRIVFEEWEKQPLKDFLIKSVNARRKAEYNVLNDLGYYNKEFIYKFAKTQGREEMIEYILVRKVFK